MLRYYTMGKIYATTFVFFCFIGFFLIGDVVADIDVNVYMTSDNSCDDGSYRIIQDRNFTLICVYGYAQGNIVNLIYSRDNVKIFDYAISGFEPLFSDRSGILYNDSASFVEIIAKFEASNNDSAVFDCSVDILDGSLQSGQSDDIDVSPFVVSGPTADVIRNNLLGADNETVGANHKVTLNTSSLFDCKAPTITGVTDDSDSAVTCVRSDTSCQFTINDLSDGESRSYTVDLELFGTTSSKLFTITYNGTQSDTTTTESQTTTIPTTTTETENTSSTPGTTTSQVISTANSSNSDGPTNAIPTTSTADTAQGSVTTVTVTSTAPEETSDPENGRTSEDDPSPTSANDPTTISEASTTTEAPGGRINELAFLAIPGVVIAVGIVVGVVYAVVNSTKAGVAGVATEGAYGAGGYYHGVGGYQHLDGITAVPYYGGYEYINAAVVRYDSPTKSGRGYQTRSCRKSSSKSLPQPYGYNVSQSAYVPRSVYNNGQSNGNYEFSRYEGCLQPQSGSGQSRLSLSVLCMLLLTLVCFITCL